MDGTARWTRGDMLRLATIVLFAAAYRWHYLTGYMPPDSMAYTQYAYNVLQGTFSLDSPSWYTHRFTVFVPIAPFYALLGVGKLTTYAWPFLLSITQILFVAWLGRRFFGAPTALLGALLLSLLPLDVVIAGRIVPDVIIAAFATFAMGCWIAGLEGRDRPHAGLLFLSGVFFCLAALTRPYALVLGLSYLIYVVWLRPSWRVLLWAALGFLAVAVPVLLAYQVQTGDPLYRLAVAKHLGEHFGKSNWQFRAYVGTLWHLDSLMALFAHLFVFAYVVAFASRSRSRVFFLVWTVPFALFLQFGSMNLTKFVPITKSLRYLSPLLAPSVLIAASALLEVVPRLRNRWIPAAAPARARATDRALLATVIVVLVVTSTLVLNRHQAPGRVWYDSSHDVVAVADEHAELPVLVDHWRTTIRLAYFMEYDEGADFYWGIDATEYVREPGAFGDSRLGYAAWYEDVRSVPDALLVVDETNLLAAREESGDDGYYAGLTIPWYCFDPPASWELLKASGDLRVYRTAPLP